MTDIEVREYLTPDGSCPFGEWPRPLMSTGKTTRRAAASRPFKASAYLRDEADIAGYLESVLEDGNVRAVPVALRTVAEAMGGMTALAAHTGLSRETLYRTLSEKGNPRLDTLVAILSAFGLRIAVAPSSRSSRPRPSCQQ